MTCLCTQNYATTAVVGQLKCNISPTDKVRKLRKVKAKLVAQKARIMTMLDANEKEQALYIEKWLNEAKSILNMIDAIELKQKVRNRWLSGILSKCCSCSNLDQHMVELIREATALSEAGDKLSNQSVTLQEMGMELPTRKIVGETTAKKTLSMIWECLRNDKSSVIGVYGMGGVGKTTIMKVINNRLLKEKQHYSKVIWVTVSKNMDILRLQDEIAKEVGLSLPSPQGEEGRSLLLLKKLSAMGRIVLILDDIWEVFPLHQIGIPEFSEDNGSKLILTSRLLEVCQLMGCKENIKVELLAEEEAWELFIETVGTELDRAVEKIAEAVAKECSGLPLAILTIAGAMRGKKDIQVWRVALKDLRESTKWIVNMEDKVIARLQFSYNYLGDDILKNCFLYCALYPEDWKIKSAELIDHWAVEGMISGRSIEDELEQGDIVLNKLRNCCMLEDSSEYDDDGVFCEIVMVHDLIRDMALHITETNPRFMVKAGEVVEELGDEIVWEENYERVSFMRSRLKKIMITPNLSKTKTMLLNENPYLHHIAHDFFIQMPMLRVLNLSLTGIELLPKSISNLVNLQVLDLSWCRELKRVHSLEKLQLLRVLKLGHTQGIEEFPQGMEELTGLKRLDLTGTKLREIPSQVIAKLFLLQELLLGDVEISNFSGDELLGLTHLESLSIRFACLKDYSCYMTSERFKHLTYCSISVGDPNRFNIPISTLNRGKGIAIDKDSLQNSSNICFPRKTENLWLENFVDISRLSELARSNDLKKMRTCKLVGCDEMQYVLVSEEESYLQHLEELQIMRADKLISIYKGIPSRGSLPCLKKLDIWYCDNLKYLFTSKLFKQLQNLVEVAITCCHGMQHLIIRSEDDLDDGISLVSTGSSSLKKLNLVFLNDLKSLFFRSMLHCFQNLEEVRVVSCEVMEDLIVEEAVMSGGSDMTVTLPSLKKFRLEDLPNLKSLWNGYLPQLKKLVILDCPKLVTLFKGVPSSDSIPCLKKLVIKKCGDLSYLFSCKLFEQLQNLVKIEIDKCDELVQLIACDDDEAVRTEVSTKGSSLKQIDLMFLPKMETLFSQRMLPYFQNLEEVSIDCCYTMEQLISQKEPVTSEGDCNDTSSDSTTIILPRLKKLYMRSLPEMRSICKGCLPHLEELSVSDCHKLADFGRVPSSCSLPCLKKLVLTNCSSLKYLFSFKFFEQLQNLVEVDIRLCNGIEELLIASENDEEAACDSKVPSSVVATSSLKRLKVWDCPKLKTLFSKSVLHYFKNLEEVRIDDCQGMEELIADAKEGQVTTEGTTTGGSDTIKLPRLKTLHLANVHNLKSIWKGVIVCSSLRSVRIHDCDSLKRLPQFSEKDRYYPTSLKEIRGKREWWDSLECDHSYLQSLFLPDK